MAWVCELYEHSFPITASDLWQFAVENFMNWIDDHWEIGIVLFFYKSIVTQYSKIPLTWMCYPILNEGVVFHIFAIFSHPGGPIFVNFRPRFVL